MPNRRPLAFIPGPPCAAFRDDDVATNVPEQARALPPDNFHQADVTAAQRILAGAPQDPRVLVMQRTGTTNATIVDEARLLTRQEVIDVGNGIRDPKTLEPVGDRIASALSVGDRVVPILNDEVGEGSPEFYPGYGEIENVYEDYGEQVADVRWDTGDRDEGVPLATLRPWTRRNASRKMAVPIPGEDAFGDAPYGNCPKCGGRMESTDRPWKVYCENCGYIPPENLQGLAYRRTAEPGGILPFFGDVPFSTAIIQNPAGTYSIVGSVPAELTEEVSNPTSWPPPRRSKVFQTLEEAEAALRSVGVTEYQIPGGGWRGREGARLASHRQTAIGSYLDSTGRQLKPGDWVQHSAGAHVGWGEIQSLGEGEELDWWGHIATFGPGKVLVSWDDGEWTGEDPGSLTFAEEGAGQTIVMGPRIRRAVADMNGRSLSYGDGVVIASTGEPGEVIGWDATAGLVQVRIEAGERQVSPTDLRRVGRGQASRRADAATPPFDPAVGDRVQIIAGPGRGQQGVVLNTGTDEYGPWAAIALDAAPEDPVLARFSDLSKVIGARAEVTANALDGEMSLEVDGDAVSPEDLTGWGLYMKTEPTPMVQMDAPFKVETMEGPMNADAGDFLAQGPEGELYPVDGDVQAKTYKSIQAGRHVAMKVRLDSDGVGFSLTNVATGEDAYFQTDWDFPNLAQSLGWFGQESDVAGASEWLAANAGLEFDVLAVEEYFSLVGAKRKGAMRRGGPHRAVRQQASTGADCWFEERTPGEWYYHLQRYPYGATQDYDVEGPFRSFEEADRHLSANYANPGGASVHPYKGPLGPSTYNPTEGSRRTAFDTGFEPLAVGDRVEVPKGLMEHDVSIEGFEPGVVVSEDLGMVEIDLDNGQHFRTWEGHLRKVPAARRSLRRDRAGEDRR